ncbi:hypothetical protein [Embleya sp. NPDC020886]
MGPAPVAVAGSWLRVAVAASTVAAVVVSLLVYAAVTALETLALRPKEAR